MSPYGALIQARFPLPQGSTVILTRKELASSGEVAWSRGGFAGIRFSHPIDADAWVDDELDGRSAAPISSKIADSSSKADEEFDRVAEELGYVGRLVEVTTERLVKDPILRQRYAKELQDLAGSTDMLRQLASIINQGCTFEAIEREANGPMRNRLMR